MTVGFLAVIITVLGVVIALGVLMLSIVGEVREELREVRHDVGDLRERMVRVESKLEVLAGEWPPPRSPADQ